MKVEKEIAGFALPFAAGVLLASLQNMVPYHILGAVTMALCVCAAGFGTQIRAHKIPATTGWTVIIALAFCCGIFCFSNAFLMNIGDWRTFSSATSSTPVGTDALYGASVFSGPSLGSPRIFAERCCISLQKCIDSIPFRREETAAIIKALLTGEKADIPTEIRTAFRESGASHILALSGMHLGIIYGIINKGLGIIGNRPKAKFIRALLTVLACGFYTLAVGAGESIVRAFIFITINETAGLTLRYRSLKQTLLVALILQLCFSPLSISSVSFQLSYAAMAGIAFIHPWLKDFWPDDGDRRGLFSIKGTAGPKGANGGPGRRGLFGKLWDSASMSISCQITTAPIAWYYFKTFPVNFILTNLLAIPLTCLIIPASILCTILHSVGICPEIILNLTEGLVRGLTWSLSVIASM